IDAVIDEALALRADRLARHHLVVERTREPVPDIDGDKDQLLQVFLNLLNNAVDAMKAWGGGSVNVSVSPGGDGVDVTVRDTGPRIPAGVLGRIFDPFFTTKAPGEGTGLGLSICHRIVTDHGGALTVENHPEGGACFRLGFPVSAAAEPAPVSDAPRV